MKKHIEKINGQLMTMMEEKKSSRGSSPQPVAAPARPAVRAVERMAELAVPVHSALTQHASVEQMMQRLRELGATVYGTKAEKWARILRAENEIAREEEIQELIRERQVRRRDRGEAYVPTLLPVPRAPSELESFTHELTHCPAEPWCEFCVMGKMQDRPHRARTLEDRERAHPEVQMDYMYLDSKMRL
eukprot:1598685-Heterocapsa_arctica.AAC.1